MIENNVGSVPGSPRYDLSKSPLWNWPRPLSGWSKTLVVVVFVASGVAYWALLLGINHFARTLFHHRIVWSTAPLVFNMLFIGGFIVAGTVCSSAVRHALCRQRQEFGRALKLGTVVGGCCALAVQVWNDITSMTGAKPYSEEEGSGSILITYVLAAVAVASGWLGWLVWRQLELRRTLPRQLQEALTRADKLGEALHQHRLARFRWQRLPDLDDTGRTLSARMAKTLDEAARALHDASDEAEDSIEKARRTAVEELLRHSDARGT